MYKKASRLLASNGKRRRYFTKEQPKQLRDDLKCPVCQQDYPRDKFERHLYAKHNKTMCLRCGHIETASKVYIHGCKGSKKSLQKLLNSENNEEVKKVIQNHLKHIREPIT